MSSHSGRTNPPILIVDDDPVCRLFCSQALLAAGYCTIEASTADGAIQMALHARPQVVVIDMHLPDMSGAAAVAKLRELWPQARTASRFIGVSGDDSTHLRIAQQSAGFAAVLIKPFVIEALLACVRKVENELLDDGNAAVPSHDCRASMSSANTPQTARRLMQRVFCSELSQQLSKLDCVITSMDWQQATEILHRLCGGAAFAGYPALARRGRRLLQQLKRPQDMADLAESYLDLLRQAADLHAGPALDARSDFRQYE